jgi:hypothetical protein
MRLAGRLDQRRERAWVVHQRIHKRGIAGAKMPMKIEQIAADHLLDERILRPAVEIDRIRRRRLAKDYATCARDHRPPGHGASAAGRRGAQARHVEQRQLVRGPRADHVADKLCARNHGAANSRRKCEAMRLDDRRKTDDISGHELPAVEHQRGGAVRKRRPHTAAQVTCLAHGETLSKRHYCWGGRSSRRDAHIRGTESITRIRRGRLDDADITICSGRTCGSTTSGSLARRRTAVKRQTDRVSR